MILLIMSIQNLENEKHRNKNKAHSVHVVDRTWMGTTLL